MAIYREDIVDIELQSGTVHRTFASRAIGEGDILANRYGVRVFRGGQPENIGGSCAGYFVRADGGTVAITGTVSGNVAYVTLPAACYAVEGQFALAIKCTGGGVTGTLRIVDGVVSNTTTDAVVDPGTIIPSVETLIAQIEAAVASLPADYSGLSDAFFGSAEAMFGTGNPGTIALGNINKTTGAAVASTVYGITEYIPVTGDFVIYTTTPSNNATVLSTYASIAFYSDDQGTFISAEDVQAGDYTTFAWRSCRIPHGARFLRAMINYSLAEYFTCVQAANLGNRIPHEMRDITGVDAIPMTAGKYVDLSGASVTMIGGQPALSGNSYSGYAVGMAPCSAGDVFTVSGKGGSQTRLWGFVDASGNILSVAASGATKTELVLQAPAGAAWIIVHTNDGRKSYKGFLYAGNWKYNSVDVMRYLDRRSGTASTVTFTWNGDTCTVNGTPTGNAWNYIVNGGSEPVPPMIRAGEKYFLRFERGAGGNVAFAVVFFKSGSAVSRNYYYSDAEIAAPDDFDAVTIALVVFGGHTASNETVCCRLFTVSGASRAIEADLAMVKDAVKDVLPRNVLTEFGTFTTATNHEVTFTWNPDHENCIVSGTADAAYAFNTMWAYTDGLPEAIQPGRQYKLEYSASDSNKVACHIYYLLPDDQTTNTRYWEDATITIPENCLGITVRLDVANGVECENVAVKIRLMTIGVQSIDGGSANHVARMFSVGSSFMTGWIYKHSEAEGRAVFDHQCSFDNSPYGNVAIGLGLEPQNVNHVLMESTGLLKVIYQSKGNILTRLLNTDLSKYDYVLTQYNRNDLGTTDSGFPLGDLDSPASQETIVGAVKTLLNYMRTNAPNATLILVGAPPSAQGEEYRGANVFTAIYGNGVSIGEADLMMHRLALQERFIFIDWEDLNLSYYYYTLCDDSNVHPRDDATVRAMGLYLARQCNYTTSMVKVLRAGGQA